MIRGLLDANVLISAAIRPSGPPGQIITAMLARQVFELVLSPRIAEEVRHEGIAIVSPRAFRDLLPR